MHNYPCYKLNIQKAFYETFYWFFSITIHLFVSKILYSPIPQLLFPVLLQPEELSWSKAREFCRTRCMDLVSMESEWEARLVNRKMKKFGARSIWTSGHICDHSVAEKCYTDQNIQPRIVRGWFWAGSASIIPPTNSNPPKWKMNPWGNTGAITLVNGRAKSLHY